MNADQQHGVSWHHAWNGRRQANCATVLLEYFQHAFLGARSLRQGGSGRRGQDHRLLKFPCFEDVGIVVNCKVLRVQVAWTAGVHDGEAGNANSVMAPASVLIVISVVLFARLLHTDHLVRFGTALCDFLRPMENNRRRR